MGFTYLDPTKSAKFKDRYVTKIDETIKTYKGSETGDVGIIGLPSSKSSISLSMAAVLFNGMPIMM